MDNENVAERAQTRGLGGAVVSPEMHPVVMQYLDSELGEDTPLGIARELGRMDWTNVFDGRQENIHKLRTVLQNLVEESGKTEAAE